ncbi:hypothetical protein PPERSA_07408 [Pseudocohnilembus persalinus]|uniref:Uncharacterized protein n=1 Tax=Pseudocohnilembus persalinus TaxID=266149 RepID=A0A0V0QA97_PSEPJ|nr:hypothetical protein PPERSA_07408 [Pseudocohnilembus persalinus]|eukprot:KRW99165.1 hypothetical protein PPERSA_07408 [Pseudocohnilembus persalinus]
MKILLNQKNSNIQTKFLLIFNSNNLIHKMPRTPQMIYKNIFTYQINQHRQRAKAIQTKVLSRKQTGNSFQLENQIQELQSKINQLENENQELKIFIQEQLTLQQQQVEQLTRQQEQQEKLNLYNSQKIKTQQLQLSQQFLTTGVQNFNTILTVSDQNCSPKNQNFNQTMDLINNKEIQNYSYFKQNQNYQNYTNIQQINPLNYDLQENFQINRNQEDSQPNHQISNDNSQQFDLDFTNQKSQTITLRQLQEKFDEQENQITNLKYSQEQNNINLFNQTVKNIKNMNQYTNNVDNIENIQDLNKNSDNKQTKQQDMQNLFNQQKDEQFENQNFSQFESINNEQLYNYFKQLPQEEQSFYIQQLNDFYTNQKNKNGKKIDDSNIQEQKTPKQNVNQYKNLQQNSKNQLTLTKPPIHPDQQYKFQNSINNNNNSNYVSQNSNSSQNNQENQNNQNNFLKNNDNNINNKYYNSDNNNINNNNTLFTEQDDTFLECSLMNNTQLNLYQKKQQYLDEQQQQSQGDNQQSISQNSYLKQNQNPFYNNTDISQNLSNVEINSQSQTQRIKCREKVQYLNVKPQKQLDSKNLSTTDRTIINKDHKDQDSKKNFIYQEQHSKKLNEEGINNQLYQEKENIQDDNNNNYNFSVKQQQYKEQNLIEELDILQNSSLKSENEENQDFNSTIFSQLMKNNEVDLDTIQELLKEEGIENIDNLSEQEAASILNKLYSNKRNQKKIYHSSNATPQNQNPYNQQIKSQLLLLNNGQNLQQNNNSKILLGQNQDGTLTRYIPNSLSEENYKLKAIIQKSDRENRKIIDDLSALVPGAKGIPSNKPIFESSLTVSLRRQIRELQTEKQKINAQLEKLKRSVKVTKLQEIEIENQELQIEITRLKENLEVQTEKNKQLYQQKENQPKRMQQLENQQIFGQKEIDELRQDNIQMANLLRNKDKIVFNLEQENSNYKKQNNSQQNHLNQLKIILKDRETEIGKLKQEIIKIKNNRNYQSASQSNFFQRTNSPFLANKEQTRVKTSQQDIRIRHQKKQLSNHQNQRQNLSTGKQNRNLNSKSRGNQRERQARVTQQDLNTVVKELRAQFFNQKTPFSKIEDLIIPDKLEEKEEVSIRELKNVLQEEPFNIKSGFKIDQLARYLVEDQSNPFVNYSPNNTASVNQIRHKFCDLIQDYEIIQEKDEFQKIKDQLFDILSSQCITLKRSLEQLSKDKVQATCQQIDNALNKQSIKFDQDQEIIFWQILYNENNEQLDLVPIGLIFQSFNLDDILKQGQKNSEQNNFKNKVHKRPNVDPITKQKQILQKQKERQQREQEINQQKQKSQESKQNDVQLEQKISQDLIKQKQVEKQNEEEKNKQIQQQQYEENEKAQLQQKQILEEREREEQIQIQRDIEQKEKLRLQQVEKEEEILRQKEFENQEQQRKQAEILEREKQEREKQEKEKQEEIIKIQKQQKQQQQQQEEDAKKKQQQLQKQIEEEKEQQKILKENEQKLEFEAKEKEMQNQENQIKLEQQQQIKQNQEYQENQENKQNDDNSIKQKQVQQQNDSNLNNSQVQENENEQYNFEEEEEEENEDKLIQNKQKQTQNMQIEQEYNYQRQDKQVDENNDSDYSQDLEQNQNLQQNKDQNQNQEQIQTQNINQNQDQYDQSNDFEQEYEQEAQKQSQNSYENQLEQNSSQNLEKKQNKSLSNQQLDGEYNQDQNQNQEQDIEYENSFQDEEKINQQNNDIQNEQNKKQNLSDKSVDDSIINEEQMD